MAFILWDNRMQIYFVGSPEAAAIPNAFGGLGKVRGMRFIV